MTCCGKTICSGCFNAPVYDNQGNIIAEKACAFCRTPESTSVEGINKRVEIERRCYGNLQPRSILF